MIVLLSRFLYLLLIKVTFFKERLYCWPGRRKETMTEMFFAGDLAKFYGLGRRKLAGGAAGE